MKFYKTLFIAFLACATFSCETEDDDQEEQVIITSPSNLTFSKSTTVNLLLPSLTKVKY
jgi:hypothetical protein